MDAGDRTLSEDAFESSVICVVLQDDIALTGTMDWFSWELSF